MPPNIGATPNASASANTTASAMTAKRFALLLISASVSYFYSGGPPVSSLIG